MIKINIKEQDNIVDFISIKGHSDYEESGKDIVCSSVSSIVITTINALVRLDKECIEYHESNGFLTLKILVHNHMIDILINNMIDLLENIEQLYSKNVKISK